MNPEKKVTKANQIFDCVSCGKKADYQETTYTVPYFGQLLISSLSCPHCQWKATQIFSLNEKKEPVKFSVKIETIEDMETKVIRSGNGTIKIPELGIEITPTTNTEGYYNNIEGLLELVQELIIESTDKNAQKTVQQISQARNGKLNFTVILEDSTGNSALIGKKVKKL
ncbi:MAG: ZPR1 zinc finger domain-containing protein [Candidatus Diapherotrites archaeon]|nr:ZPR1 zinc finger domain-containing protein [Candidatus Diapherotrites archaeon]